MTWYNQSFSGICVAPCIELGGNRTINTASLPLLFIAILGREQEFNKNFVEIVSDPVLLHRSWPICEYIQKRHI